MRNELARPHVAGVGDVDEPARGVFVIMLIIAGTIEGFVSTSDLGFSARAIISVSSGLILVFYLAVGARAARRGA